MNFLCLTDLFANVRQIGLLLSDNFFNPDNLRADSAMEKATAVLKRENDMREAELKRKEKRRGRLTQDDQGNAE